MKTCVVLLVPTIGCDLIGRVKASWSDGCCAYGNSSKNNKETTKNSEDFVGEGHVLCWLWDLSRTPAPSLLSFGIPGHPLVSRRNSSGEEQVTRSALGFRHEKVPAEAGALGSAAGGTQKSLFRGSSTFTASSGPADTSGSVAVSMGLDLPVTRSVMAAASAKGSAIGAIKSDPV